MGVTLTVSHGNDLYAEESITWGSYRAHFHHHIDLGALGA